MNTWELVILLFRIFLIGDFLHFSCVCSPWLVLNIFAHHGWSGRVVLSSKLFQMAFGKTSRSRASALKKKCLIIYPLNQETSSFEPEGKEKSK